MKKLFLILAAIVSLASYQAFGQTISVTGQNVTSSAGAFVDITLTLNITGTNSIGNVESVNMLLRALTADGGQNFFTLSNVTPIAPFTLANNGAPSTFNAPGDSFNTGYTVSDTGIDMGSNAPAATAPTVASSGTTSFAFETVRFTAAGGTPNGVYHFGVSLGGLAGAQGSWIDNSADATFDINSAPDFTITVEAVPEPSTWLAGIGAAGVIGYTMLRRRQTA
jgi:PEP-CTERM motif